MDQSFGPTQSLFIVTNQEEELGKLPNTRTVYWYIPRVAASLAVLEAAQLVNRAVAEAAVQYSTVVLYSTGSRKPATQAQCTTNTRTLSVLVFVVASELHRRKKRVQVTQLKPKRH